MTAQKVTEPAVVEGTIPAKTYPIPVSNGIFEHREQIGAAIWTFLWLIDKTTREVRAADGSVEGFALWGKGIPARDIARDLRLEVRSVYEHIETLVSRGYVRKIDHGPGRPTGFVVAKSKKWGTRLDTTPELLPQSTPELFRTGCEVKVHKPLNFSATRNRKETIHTKRLEDTPLSGPEGLSATVARAVVDDLNILSDRFFDAIMRVAKNEMLKGAVAADLRKEMVSAWRDYDKISSGEDPKYGPPNFFLEGVWRQRSKWPKAQNITTATPRYDDPTRAYERFDRRAAQ